MATHDYDVVVVGARVAGATLGTLLARAGATVLLIDRDSLPSDQVLSTHTIHPPGTDVLDELGVGDAVRAEAPASSVMRLVKDEATVDVPFPNGRAEYCPRRRRLDGLLQSAALEAGAELIDRTRVEDLRLDGDRVVGVRATSGGQTREFRARLVVGADGRRSTVAERVGAEEYLAYDAPRGMYWAYWNAPAEWRSDRYPFDMYLAHRGDDIRFIFQTDDGQLLVGSVPDVEAARSWRSDPLASLRANLAVDPITGPLLADAEPDGHVRGTLKERYFFRRAAGPGWALVGDAGHHKDFVIGDGITEALLQAKSLAGATLTGTDEALVRWWRARDVEALPLYFWGRGEGSAGGTSELERLVFGRLARDPARARLLARLPEHQASPYDVLPMPLVMKWVLGAVLRGRLRLVPQFLARGRSARRFAGLMEERRRLLAEAEPR